jgi:hypothetical protein
MLSRHHASGLWTLPLASIAFTSIARAGPPYDLSWIRQPGTTGADEGHAIAADGAGGAYLGGFTQGNLLGEINAGSSDAFIVRYDDAGAVLWARLIGTAAQDQCNALARTGAGDLHFAGQTLGNLYGPNSGSTDIVFARLGPTAIPVWARQIGTSAVDQAYGIAVDGIGNVFVCGETSGNLLGETNAGSNDAFLVKYDATGAFLWCRLLGTSAGETARGVAVDQFGDAYICGSTSGSLGGPSAGGSDIFVAKFEASGDLLWTRQSGTSDLFESSSGVALDAAGNVLACGSTAGNLEGEVNAGSSDAFVVKYDPDGHPFWTRLLGSSAGEEAHSITIDAAGDALIAGSTGGTLAGPSAGGTDAFAAEFDTNGAHLWTRQLGSAGSDIARAIALDGLNRLSIGGRTNGSLGGPPAGGNDAFIAPLLRPVLDCPGDLNDDGMTSVTDLLSLLADWGSCP